MEFDILLGGQICILLQQNGETLQHVCLHQTGGAGRPVEDAALALFAGQVFGTNGKCSAVFFVVSELNIALPLGMWFGLFPILKSW